MNRVYGSGFGVGGLGRRVQGVIDRVWGVEGTRDRRRRCATSRGFAACYGV